MSTAVASEPASWQSQCEQVFAKVARQLHAREQLCAEMEAGEVSLRSLLLDNPPSEVLASYKLLMLLDAMPGVGKVPARKLLGERHSWKVRQFSPAELTELVAAVEALAEASTGTQPEASAGSETN